MRLEKLLARPKQQF